jgi:Exportin 1-like protein
MRQLYSSFRHNVIFATISIIDQLRAAPDRWSVGLKLFFEGRSELSRFFGLSLIRDFLASAFNPTSTTYAVHQQNPTLVYTSIRDAIWSWTTCNIVQHIPIPVFILNNLVTVLALLVKLLFPESWPLAFSDLLAVGRESTAGLDLVVRVICDLEVEVVMFSEGRGKQEVIHNVLIKDAMRANENSIVKQLVEFLCQSAASVRSSNVELSERCLRCLAELIGWIDVSLVACESTLSCLYLALRDAELCGAVLACLLELVKKGMEPVQKIKMLHAIGLAQVLTSVPISSGSTQADDSDDTEGAEDELGLVVDVYLVELLGCWSKYEDSLFGASSASDTGTRPPEPENSALAASESQQLKDLAPSISSLLHSLLPISLALLNHRDAECEVATTVVPCLGRLIVLMKQQLTHKPQIDAMIARDGGKSNFFLAYDYLPPLLLGIYQQMQFEEDFSYDPSDDTDAAIIEVQ